jgi:hypothetical protein
MSALAAIVPRAASKASLSFPLSNAQYNFSIAVAQLRLISSKPTGVKALFESGCLAFYANLRCAISFIVLNIPWEQLGVIKLAVDQAKRLLSMQKIA